METKAPKPRKIEQITRRVRYVGKKQIAERIALLNTPSSVWSEAERAYLIAYREHFFERFPDHPLIRWDGCLQFPEHPLHVIYTNMQASHAAVEAERDKVRSALKAKWPYESSVIDPERNRGEPKFDQFLAERDAMRASFKANPSTLEQYRANLNELVKRWEAEHKAEARLDIESWVSEHAP